MKTNIYQFKKQPISQVVADALTDVTEFDWYDVFSAGKHTDSAGNTREWTEADLDSVVANFKASSVPLVIGHPKTNAPAYGWVSDVRKTDDLRLEIKASDVNPEFAKAVAAKAFPNRSVRFERVENGIQLVHVGHLGGKAPALDGLPWQFSGNEDATTTLEFSLSPYTQRSFLDMFSRLRDWMIDSISLEKANEILPEWMLSNAREELGRELEQDNPQSYFNKPPKEPDVSKFTQEQLDAAVKQAAEEAAEKTSNDFSKKLADAESEAKKAKDKLEESEFAATVAQCQEIVDKLVDSGVLVPANATGLAEFMASLKSNESSTFSFSADDGKSTVEKTPFDFAKGFVESLGTKSPLGDGQEAIESNNDDLDKKATEYSSKHNVSYADAVIAVSNT